ncbi:hypothetical protein EBU99_09070 [bacterium]|nr:hypothetical protein [bacterium]
MRHVLFAFILASSSLNAWAAEWDLDVDSDGIKVWTRHKEGSRFKEAKGEVVVDGAPQKAFSVIVSAETCREWVYRCVDSYVISRPRPQDGIVYMRTNSFWPISDRDAVFLAETSQDEKSQILKANMIQKNDVIPAVEGVVRITAMVGSWEVHPYSATQSKVVFWSHVEPGGFLPAALVNLALSNLHKNSLKSLRELLAKKRK